MRGTRGREGPSRGRGGVRGCAPRRGEKTGAPSNGGGAAFPRPPEGTSAGDEALVPRGLERGSVEKNGPYLQFL